MASLVWRVRMVPGFSRAKGGAGSPVESPSLRNTSQRCQTGTTASLAEIAGHFHASGSACKGLWLA